MQLWNHAFGVIDLSNQAYIHIYAYIYAYLYIYIYITYIYNIYIYNIYIYIGIYGSIFGKRALLGHSPEMSSIVSSRVKIKIGLS